MVRIPPARSWLILGLGLVYLGGWIGSHAQAIVVQPSTGDEVSLLVLYTADALEESGGEAELHAEIAAAVAGMNSTLASSAVAGSIRIAGVFSTDYTERDDYRAMLEDLRLGFQDPGGDGVRPSDPSLIDLRCMRDLFGADLITMLVAAPGTNGRNGIADQLHSLAGDPALAFSVIRRSAAIENNELAHQLGHNLGAHHESALATLAIAHAWELDTPNFGKLRTLMWSTRDPDSALSRYSNPDVTFDGEPTGTIQLANNASVIAATIVAVSAYRADPEPISQIWSFAGDDAFGTSIASDHSSLAIGRPAFFDTNYGRVDLFSLEDTADGCGIVVGEPFNPDDADAWTGTWLDMSGDLLIAGGAGESGAAYILRRDPRLGWLAEALLVDSDISPDNFANNGAIQGTTAIVQESAIRLHPGMLHIYEHTDAEWLQTQTIILPLLFDDPNSSDIGLDLLDDRIAIGVQVRFQIPSVATLVRDDTGVWQPEQSIACMTCEGLPGFRDLALSGSRLAVSHRQGVDLHLLSPNARSASRFAPEQTLRDPRITIGGPVATAPGVVIMGDPTAGGDLRGGVFVWAWNPASELWVIEDLILGEPGERLGTAVALNGPWIFASTHPEGVRAYFRSSYSPPPPGCTIEAQIPAGDIETQPGQRVEIIASVADDRGEDFAWFLNGDRLSDDGTFDGTDTTTLTIDPVGEETIGLYEFEATEGPCSASAGVTLSIRCPADLDGDGDGDADDLLTFLEALEAGDADICDLDGDADCDGDDFFAFLDLLSTGC